MKAFRKIRALDSEVAALQNQVEAVLNPLIRVPLVDGVQIKDIAVGTTPVEVPHLLGRQPLGWFIVDNNADARVWRINWNNLTLTLDASASATIAIWVY